MTRTARTQPTSALTLPIPVALALALAMAVFTAAVWAPAVAHADIDAPSNAGWLEVANGNLTSAETGETVMLRGVSTHGLAWYPKYVNGKCFKMLRRDWGANVVRLAMYTAELGYCDGYSKKKLEKRVRDGVKYATKNDLYVIIDWHILTDGNPNTYVKQARLFFMRMAKKYANNKNVIFEICNEPNGKGTWKRVKKYAYRIIPAIRKYAKRNVILVGTPNWCTRVEKAAKSPLAKRYRPNVMYTTHFYANTHRELHRQLVIKAKKKGLPVFASEYGISDASGNGSINELEGAEWMDLLNQYQISSCAWSLSNKRESSALIRSTCRKKYGFTYGNLTASGKWLYDMLQVANYEDEEEDEPDTGDGTTTPANPSPTPSDDQGASGQHIAGQAA